MLSGENMSRLIRIFPAQLQAFDQIRALVDEFGAMSNLGREDRHKLTLIVEELFTNTVAHGHQGDSDAHSGASIRSFSSIRAGRVSEGAN